jgi:hypothetical protein
MKDFPRYITVKYYYSDKSSSDTFLFGEKSKILIASLLFTEDNFFYLNLCQGAIITPDSFLDDRIYPTEWQNQKCIKYAIDYQPYDFEEWHRGHAMYSKDFWLTTYKDIREFKIKLALGDFEPTGNWVG